MAVSVLVNSLRAKSRNDFGPRPTAEPSSSMHCNAATTIEHTTKSVRTMASVSAGDCSGDETVGNGDDAGNGRGEDEGDDAGGGRGNCDGDGHEDEQTEVRKAEAKSKQSNTADLVDDGAMKTVGDEGDDEMVPAPGDNTKHRHSSLTDSTDP